MFYNIKDFQYLHVIFYYVEKGPYILEIYTVVFTDEMI